VNTQI